MEITDQRLFLTRQDLRTTVANAEPQLTEIKARFFSAAAHELRTPLTTIVGYLEMLLNEEFGPLSEGQREPLEVVNESARHLRAVTNNLLAVAQIEAGRINLDVRPTDLSSLVRAVADSIEPQLRAKAQRLELDAPSDLPPVLCDARRTMQITDTLLGSACERTPKGGEIDVRVAQAEVEGFLQVTVADTGAALGAKEMAEMAEYLSAGGLGLIEADVANLELCVACSLVELHGGHVWCESGAETGGSFYATFPIAGGLAVVS
ncbi:MAG: HAMP domain-containing histidine kinase [Anaerolineae bacterium]|nr:HAMP domain-containing histidine kinase [Anaerolineae bacterium]